MRRISFVLILAVGLAACGGDDEPASSGASLALGGALYDKFWRESSAKRPTETHPLWSQRPDAATNKRTGPDTWRCKECHGWDYKGVDGAYAKGSHRTGFGGVFESKLGEKEIIASLRGPHAYPLNDDELKSLAMFIRRGLVDTDKYIDGTGAFQGDPEKGKQYYLNGLGKNGSCKSCHGADGLKIPKGAPPDYEEFVGKIANKNPQEFLHKVRYGHPGSKMPAAVTAGVTMQKIVDLCAYAQTLPKSE